MERCEHCGQKLRQYKQRAYPTRDKVVEVLKDGPKTALALAAVIGIKTTSLTRLLRLYEEQGVVCRRGLEPFYTTQTFTRTLSKRSNTATMVHYRTLWGLPGE